MNGEGAYAFAKRAGFNESLIRKYLSGASTPLIEKAGELAQALKVDLNWLATGKGAMRPSSIQSQPFAPRTAPMPADESVMDNFALVSLYNVEASAGHGAVVDEEQEISQLAFRKKWLKNKNLRQDKLALIKARGDSMEPTLSDGDLLLVDTSIEKIIDDAIYVIQTDHHLVVKRLQQSFDCSLSIISDNPRYNQQRLDPEQARGLKIAGRVCWCCHEM